MRFFPQERPVVISLLSVVLGSLLLTRIPLLNYLGFESSAVMAVLVGMVAGIMTISLWSRLEGTSTGMSHGGDKSLVDFVRHASIPLLVVWLAPLTILSANAFIVKNCSMTQGLFFYATLVLPSLLLCAAIGLLLSVGVRRWKKTWFVVIMFIMLAQIAVVTFTRPQIFAFNPVVGFFPGVTYDETLAVEGKLVLYRWTTLGAAALISILSVFVHRRRRMQPDHQLFHWMEGAAAAILALALLSTWVWSDELGFSSTESSVAEQLGGRYETEHFIIFYPKERMSQHEVDRVARLHEFYFAKLGAELGAVPVRKISSFLYASPEQKGRLVGAGRTNIAKPWLWQLHINVADVEASLKHELVHVMAAEFGFPLFRVGLNAGLIEGLATAVERTAYNESLHRVAAQMLAVGVNPDLEGLFSWTGFMRAHPSVSYTLAGSFCRFLIDRYGMRRFRRLYRTGDFRRFYNKDITLLIGEWRRSLERYEITEAERERAEYLFRRPTIFGKECARVIAALNAETQRLMQRKEYEHALRSSTRSLELTVSTEAVSQQMNSLVRLQRFDEAIPFASRYLADSTLARALPHLRLPLGDALWASGEVEEAKRAYERVLAIQLSPSWTEAAAVRLEALKSPFMAEVLLFYFVSEIEDTLRFELLSRTARESEARTLALFLLGREYAARGQYKDVVDALSPIPRMASDGLELSRQLRLGRAFTELGQHQRAKVYFWQAMNFTTNDATLTQIREWLDRCEWMDQHQGRFPQGAGS
jgi:tetratricopeptide (TPR) repeat protein